MMTLQNCHTREQLYEYISMLRFSMYDTTLFLDTHPKDEEALCYYKKVNEMLQTAIKEYGRLYEPLNLATVCSSDDHWKWVHQPWPWEGGYK